MNLRTMVLIRCPEPDEAVLQQTELAHLKKPNPRDLRFLTEWMERPDMGNVLLESQDSDVYENPDRLDLVVLKPRKSESLLTTWLSDSVVHWFHQNIRYRLAVRYTHVSDSVQANVFHFYRDYFLQHRQNQRSLPRSLQRIMLQWAQSRILLSQIPSG